MSEPVKVELPPVRMTGWRRFWGAIDRAIHDDARAQLRQEGWVEVPPLDDRDEPRWHNLRTGAWSETAPEGWDE